ncbi:Rna polymerase ii c-terminal domain phosphatase-like [Thalictrum thalictroides]|uniref:protein-serine/threonine phosphatase n=1 Tax=Thalictrum thalictroides TaxID=46969 RepID=A0A7J6V8F8_THATH|nr:Rna polymerase ii c-terminal domain phosphatase-like [Thalictrum thalictroides]
MDICEDSWLHIKHNLVLIERYTYFPRKELHKRHKTQSLLKCDLDEQVEDGTLTYTLAVWLFLDENIDVRKLLATEKKRILAGCRIVFNGLFGLQEANPQKYDRWHLAE